MSYAFLPEKQDFDIENYEKDIINDSKNLSGNSMMVRYKNKSVTNQMLSFRVTSAFARTIPFV